MKLKSILATMVLTLGVFSTTGALASSFSECTFTHSRIEINADKADYELETGRESITGFIKPIDSDYSYLTLELQGELAQFSARLRMSESGYISAKIHKIGKPSTRDVVVTNKSDNDGGLVSITHNSTVDRITRVGVTEFESKYSLTCK